MSKEYTYFAVMESTKPDDTSINILSHIENNTIHSLRFSTCLQSFGKRNRNGRLWQKKYMEIALLSPMIHELMTKGDWAGENGHPIPDVGDPSINRIATINPNNICHKILNFEFRGDLLYGEIETIDDISGPGMKFYKSIIQHMEPAFSLRSLVPQRKNSDGTIDVLGPGRVITYDRVILPSHEEAYRDINVDIRQVVSSSQYSEVMESLIMPYIADHSDAFKYVTDGISPAMESSSYDHKNGLISIKTDDPNRSRIFIKAENDVQSHINDFMKNF